MKFMGSDSWQISVNQWDWLLEPALWVRAAERIDVPVGGVVPMPVDRDELPELPEPSVGSAGESSAALAEGWLHVWNTALSWPQPRDAESLAEMARFSPPDFAALADFPDFRRVFAARWPEAHAWHSARKRAGIGALRDRTATVPRGNIEGDVVKAVEAELGRTAAPFQLRLILLPVAEDLVRPVSDETYLVPERLRRTAGYREWLTGVVRELA